MIELADHQRAAVDRVHELLARYGGALLADDVGLGKSHVAAAVAEDARRRGVAVELVVPAQLVTQWREIVDAPIVTHDRCGTDIPVCSAQTGMSAPHRLVIVDEAHAFRNPRTQRYAALARRSVGAQVLLVTATPICNSLHDLEALLALLVSDDALAHAGVPSIDVAFERRDPVAIEIIVGELVIRRDRSVLPPSLSFGELERRVVRHPVYQPALPLIDAMRFPLVGGEAALLRRFLMRRLESSEAALFESIRRQLRFYERALACLAAGRALPKREYRRAFGHEEDRDAFQHVLFWELFAPAGGEVDVDEIRAEIGRLEELRTCVEGSPREKRRMFVEWMRAAAEPALVFTGSAATAHDLAGALRGVRRCGVVTARDRRLAGAALAAFRRGELETVIATDLASEGLNLQRAGCVVHYDIPWNPVKLDQRNGRAHRIGQTRATVRAVYFLPEGDETGVVAAVAAKNRTRRRVLRVGGAPITSAPPTLRPRLTRSAAAFRLFAAGVRLPGWLERRNKAGVEQLLGELIAGEPLDQRSVDAVVRLLELERGDTTIAAVVSAGITSSGGSKSGGPAGRMPALQVTQPE